MITVIPSLCPYDAKTAGRQLAVGGIVLIDSAKCVEDVQVEPGRRGASCNSRSSVAGKAAAKLCSVADT